MYTMCMECSGRTCAMEHTRSVSFLYIKHYIFQIKKRLSKLVKRGNLRSITFGGSGGIAEVNGVLS